MEEVLKICAEMMWIVTTGLEIEMSVFKECKVVGILVCVCEGCTFKPPQRNNSSQSSGLQWNQRMSQIKRYIKITKMSFGGEHMRTFPTF